MMPCVRQAISKRWAVGAAICSRLALLVSLWHAPVPWVHRHHPTADLPVHLATHHAHDPGVAGGWHMHCELPLWGHTEHGGSPADDHHHGCGRVFFDPAIGPSASTGLVGWDAGPWTATILAPVVTPCSVAQQDAFLHSLLMDASRPPVFRRCQC